MRFLIQSELDRQRAVEYLRALKPGGKVRWTFECKQFRRPRSNAANKTLWMWYHVLSADTGVSVDDLHEYCKRKFLPAREVAVPDGKTIRLPGSTRLLDSKQFSDYMNCVQEWAIDTLGSVLPDPSNAGFDAMIAQYGD